MSASWRRLLATGGVLACVASAVACGDAIERIPRSSNTPPTAEFLVAAGDSSYWVRSNAEGLRVRSAPLLLTRADGAFHELRIVEDVVDYLDAEFVREQLYGYPLGRTDSVLLFDNASVTAAMQQWLREHPDEQPIDPAEAEAPDPASSAADFLEVIDVHGRWISWAYSLDIDIEGAVSHTHLRKRGVVNIENGAAATLDSLVSSAEAARILVAGRASLDTMLAVVRGASDARAARARETLHTFAFDPSSFSIGNEGRTPSITFHVAGTGADGEALELLLPPIAISEKTEWWLAVEPMIPFWGGDSLNVRWSQALYTVTGAVDSSRTSIALSLVADTIDATPWPLAVVPMPAYQFIALDRPGIDPALRRTLERAFDRASGDDPYATRALGRRPTAPVRAQPPFRHARRDAK